MTKEYIQEGKQKGYDLPVEGENYINNKTKIKHTDCYIFILVKIKSNTYYKCVDLNWGIKKK